METIFTLTSEEVDKQVTPNKAGVYQLLTFNTFLELYVVKYVGRSDTDLNARLKQHCSKGYDAFCFEYADTPLDAYQGECTYYHHYNGDIGLLDNKSHPDLPDGVSGVVCPICQR